MDQTGRIGLPMLNAGQLQKEIWHNESLLLLDGLVCGRVVGTPAATPPAAGADGCWYRIAAGATGAWAGHDDELAIDTAGGWRFLVPFDGLRLRDADDRTSWEYVAGVWRNGVEQVREVQVGGVRVVGARAAAISDPGGGAVEDVEAREAIREVLAALREHGLIG